MRYVAWLGRYLLVVGFRFTFAATATTVVLEAHGELVVAGVDYGELPALGILGQ